MTNQNQEIGGQPVHIRDCYIWAEIQYLESRTDYREYLPQYTARPPVLENGLLMLDSARDWCRSNPQRAWGIASVSLFISCLLLYWLG